MKSEPTKNTVRKQRVVWIIDENKCFSSKEVRKLRNFCNKERIRGMQNRKFSPVRNWFMVELGLNDGLRVSEMASLQHGDLLIDENRSSIVVVGKGNKKRSVWISSHFKKTCKTYFGYKESFGYEMDDDSYLLNNLKGSKISKRALQKFFKKILEETGLPQHYHIHCLRHTYTTFLLKASNYNAYSGPP